jgi:hypothetical protein
MPPLDFFVIVKMRLRLYVYDLHGIGRGEMPPKPIGD